MTARELLEEINQRTGLELMLPEEELAKPKTVERLAALLESGGKCGGKGWTGEDFFRRYLLGEVSGEELQASGQTGEGGMLIRRGTNPYHLEQDAVYALFLLMFQAPYDDLSAAVLSSLATGSDTIVEMDATHIVLVRRLSQRISLEEMARQASHILDALGSEAMQAVRVSYDGPVEGWEALPASYRHTRLALQLGMMFQNDRRIHSYQEVSLEKLIYRVPREDALEYLSEHFGSVNVSALDNEMRSTIKALFHNQLNLADTARELYIHRNTLVYRLDKIQKLMGLDLRKFDDAVCCRIGMILSEYVK